jgi:hypothetical protein
VGGGVEATTLASLLSNAAHYYLSKRIAAMKGERYCSNLTRSFLLTNVSAPLHL